MPISDTTSGQIVGREGHRDTVSDEDTDPETRHPARSIGQDLMPILQLDTKVLVG